MTTEARKCNKCGYKVTYMDIDDAHDPRTCTQYVAMIPNESGESYPAVTDNCPQCKSKLNHETTSKI